MKKKTSFNAAAAYDSAPQAGAADAPGAAGPSAGGGSFSDDYDQAPAATQEGDPDQDADQDGAQTDLDIPAADVTKMQSLKDKGDMAGLGNYVAQFLK